LLMLLRWLRSKHAAYFLLGLLLDVVLLTLRRRSVWILDTFCLVFCLPLTVAVVIRYAFMEGLCMMQTKWWLFHYVTSHSITAPQLHWSRVHSLNFGLGIFSDMKDKRNRNLKEWRCRLKSDNLLKAYCI
jgi:hypothetical protein